MSHQSQQLIHNNPVDNAQKIQANIIEKPQLKNGINLVPIQMEVHNSPYESQFLDIDPQMMNKLQIIEQTKQQSAQFNRKTTNIAPITALIHSSHEEQKQQQTTIKRQFVHKLKQWQREREELKIRKQEIEQKKLKQKQQLKMKKQRQQQEEREFLRLQKQKQIQQKIQEIEERRLKRESSLKNVMLKRSFNQFPSYVDQEQKYKEQQHQQIQINIKLLKNKKQLSKLDPEELKIHQQAYIQRIKQRLNIIPKKQKHQKAKSDFNLYLKRNDQKKQQQLNKIIKMKKYQEKINQIPIKISEHKKEQKLIEIDKIKNPQKYRLLANKLLNDQQIFEQFKDFQLNIDRKQIGINYLKELKQLHQKEGRRNKRSNSQIIKLNPEERLPNINKKYEQITKMTFRQQQKTKSVELQHSSSYKLSLEKDKEKDRRYMKALKQKLALAIDG